jgi:hypothetical protein
LLAVFVVADGDVRSVALVVEEDERRHVLADVGEDLARGWSYVGRHCRLGLVVGGCGAMNEILAASSDTATMLRVSS